MTILALNKEKLIVDNTWHREIAQLEQTTENTQLYTHLIGTLNTASNNDLENC